AQINWHAPMDSIYNLIRGCNPAPGAWTMVSGKKVRLFDARRHASRRFADVSGKPGEIVSIGEHGVLIAAQGGAIELLKVKPDGGEKTSAATFFRSNGLVAGNRLGVLVTA